MSDAAKPDFPVRLNAFLAKSGVCSRRAADALIAEGRVSMNGAVVRELGTKVERGDAVAVDGKAITPEKDLHYIALNKPPGYLCSTQDPDGRPLASDLLPKLAERLFSVGRLDLFSSGLIIFTNDGALASKLGHPSTSPEKEYLVETAEALDPAVLARFEKGITIEGVRYKALRAEALGATQARIVLSEGKNREIRNVLAAFGLKPRLLRRIRIGDLPLGTLPEGAWRRLTEAEIRSLREHE
jgi:23S rRNA pseudouridine2605 synthase